MHDKTFLVVGGSHGIGLGLSEQLLQQGASVVVVSRTPGELDRLDASLLPRCVHHRVDVTTDEIDAIELPARIDGVAYCAGSLHLSSLRMTKLETVRDDFELNVVAALRIMQRVLPALKAAETSSVVLFSTVAVGRGMAMHTSVSACKGAIEGVMRTWAAELAPNIRVNCVAPALIDTPLSARLLAGDAKRKAMAAMYPLGRIGCVQDVASLARFLISDESSWITGQVVGVDGGMSRVQK